MESMASPFVRLVNRHLQAPRGSPRPVPLTITDVGMLTMGTAPLVATRRLRYDVRSAGG